MEQELRDDLDHGGARGTGALVRVRHFAAARAAAGVPEEELDLAGEVDLGAVVAELERRHGDRMARVLASVSFLVDGVAARGRDTPLPAVCSVDVLPPFAGG
ncbi:MoaD/ThiS family protein [Actinokineospora bangkokensis]|uniref:Molybdopterin synthase sulfur carrier subunit n=1 Tax=Actinokineospora bangkokensis TaxID=1193682 RepID=A0A1Q9LCX1_9PSEU|nr:MoaD/ThiS family protein [Actinokineospora bangkokensis]OLR89863.1 hypothetical protein BJP25_02275 [Actinokineospora bangkokensis]